MKYTVLTLLLLGFLNTYGQNRPISISIIDVKATDWHYSHKISPGFKVEVDSMLFQWSDSSNSFVANNLIKEIRYRRRPDRKSKIRRDIVSITKHEILLRDLNELLKSIDTGNYYFKEWDEQFLRSGKDTVITSSVLVPNYFSLKQLNISPENFVCKCQIAFESYNLSSYMIDSICQDENALYKLEEEYLKSQFVYRHNSAYTQKLIIRLVYSNHNITIMQSYPGGDNTAWNIGYGDITIKVVNPELNNFLEGRIGTPMTVQLSGYRDYNNIFSVIRLLYISE